MCVKGHDSGRKEKRRRTSPLQDDPIFPFPYFHRVFWKIGHGEHCLCCTWVPYAPVFSTLHAAIVAQLSQPKAVRRSESTVVVVAGPRLRWVQWDRTVVPACHDTLQITSRCVLDKSNCPVLHRTVPDNTCDRCN